MRKTFWALFAPIAVATLPAWADVTIPQEYGKHITTAEVVGRLGTDLFGEQINLYTGSTEFVVTDVSLPGNNALPVAIGRRFQVKSREFEASWAPETGMFRDWDLEIPHLHGIFPLYRPWQVHGSDNDLAARTKRCSVDDAITAQPPVTKGFGNPAGLFYPGEYWQGNHLYVPGLGDQEMLVYSGSGNPNKPTDGKTYHWVTQQQWFFSCLVSTANGIPGEAFLATAPDGARYWFDWIVERSAPPLVKPFGTGGVDFLTGDTSLTADNDAPQASAGWMTSLSRRDVWILPTRIEDRFGNYVTYTYDVANPWRLLKIISSDGRQLTLSYNAAGDVESVTDGQRIWKYSYSAYTSGWILSSVELPDQSKWAINFAGVNNAWVKPYNFGIEGASSKCPDPAMWSDAGQQTYVGTMTHPSGAVGEFAFRPKEHGRSYVPLTCIKISSDVSDQNYYAHKPYRFANVALISKKVSGPGLPAYQWNYSYGPLNYSWAEDCGNCASTKTVEVAGPDQFIRYTFGNRYGYNEGKLIKTESGASENAILRTENLTYVLDSVNQPYPAKIGVSPNFRGDQTGQELTPILQRELIQQGTTFTWQANSFDQFGNPLSATRSSTPGSYSRTDVTARHHNLSKWVIGQAGSSTNSNTGMVESQTTYDANALPWKIYAFGKLQQTLTYDTASSVASGQRGTLKTSADGKGNTTKYADWRRGIPQQVTYADGKVKSAVVSNIGTIASVTDENLYNTYYGYDAMGRLDTIDYPNGDSVDWNNTTLAFEQIASAEYGLPAGHWRQTVRTGNGYKVSYFDALWRPRLVREYDSGDVAGTIRSQLTCYDHEGRPTYASYAKGDVANVSCSLTGTRTAYDAIGRVQTVEQDSELGVLTTTTEYLNNSQGPYTRVKNPRGFYTRTWFQAFDAPSQDAPVAIQHEEGAYTDIVRDVFGKPKSITRATRPARSRWRGSTSTTTTSACARPSNRKPPPPCCTTTMRATSTGRPRAWPIRTRPCATTAACLPRPRWRAATMRATAWRR